MYGHGALGRVEYPDEAHSAPEPLLNLAANVLRPVTGRRRLDREIRGEGKVTPWHLPGKAVSANEGAVGGAHRVGTPLDYPDTSRGIVPSD